MKKFLLLSIVAVATMSAVCYTIHVSHNSESALTLANIEALSRDEFGYDDCCIFTGNFSDQCYPNSGPILYGYKEC